MLLKLGYSKLANAKEDTDNDQKLFDSKPIDAAMKTQSLLQIMLDATTDGILVIDCQQKKYQYNRQFIKMWNIDETVLTNNIQSRLLTLVLKKVKDPKTYVEKLRNFYTCPGESCDIVELKDGRFFERCCKVQWLGSEVTGSVFNFRDITKEKQAEKIAKQNEKKIQMLLNNNKDGIALFSINKNGTAEKIIEVNDRACEWLGYKKEELLEMSPNEIANMIPSSMFEMLNKSKNKSLKAVSYETVNLASKDSQIRLEMNVNRFEVDGQNFSLCTARNVEERDRIETEMAHLERMNLIGKMAAGIGHEVRNPMTTIRGFLQMLVNKKECQQYWEYYKLMIEELDRANCIITEFLSLAKDRVICRRSKNLNVIINSLVPLIKADAIVANKYIKTELGDIPELFVDDKEIRQLILNLVRNSLDAMLPGSYLIIKTYREDEGIVLAIEDQGTGIDPEVLSNIGKPFFTTKEQGTGLGLAICYSIAAHHNATINVETSEDGTTFFIKFNQKQYTMPLIC